VHWQSMEYSDKGIPCRVPDRLEKISYAKRMTGFEKLQTREEHQTEQYTLTIQIAILKAHDYTLVLSLVGQKIFRIS